MSGFKAIQSRDVKACLDLLELSEHVDFRPRGGPTVEGIPAYVEDHGDFVGETTQTSTRPIMVVVSKVDVPIVREQLDEFYWKDKRYTVVDLREETAASYRCYCVH